MRTCLCFHPVVVVLKGTVIVTRHGQDKSWRRRTEGAALEHINVEIEYVESKCAEDGLACVVSNRADGTPRSDDVQACRSPHKALHTEASITPTRTPAHSTARKQFDSPEVVIEKVTRVDDPVASVDLTEDDDVMSQPTQRLNTDACSPSKKRSNSQRSPPALREEEVSGARKDTAREGSGQMSTSPPKIALTQEQRERIERNRSPAASLPWCIRPWCIRPLLSRG